MPRGWVMEAESGGFSAALGGGGSRQGEELRWDAKVRAVVWEQPWVRERRGEAAMKQETGGGHEGSRSTHKESSVERS